LVCSLESDQPITLKKYKDIWTIAHGFEYEKDFSIDLKGLNIKDDNSIMDDSVIKEHVFEMWINFFMDDILKGAHSAVDIDIFTYIDHLLKANN